MRLLSWEVQLVSISQLAYCSQLIFPHFRWCRFLITLISASLAHNGVHFVSSGGAARAVRSSCPTHSTWIQRHLQLNAIRKLNTIFMYFNFGVSKSEQKLLLHIVSLYFVVRNYLNQFDQIRATWRHSEQQLIEIMWDWNWVTATTVIREYNCDNMQPARHERRASCLTSCYFKICFFRVLRGSKKMEFDVIGSQTNWTVVNPNSRVKFYWSKITNYTTTRKLAW